ncbi:MAG: hypothetical protein J7L15_00355 [Clostridiales bacterium]|nr:hypothetical protein [Clostridiales bacterium]
MSRKELILGCECMSVDHIARFDYFPLKKEDEDKDEDEDDVIYMSVPARNYYNSFSLFYFWGVQWDSFCRFNFFKRFYFAFAHIFRSKKFISKWKEGILDSFEFQNQDEDKLYNFLNLLAKDEEQEISCNILTDKEAPLTKSCCFENFDVCFYIDNLIYGDHSFPYMLQYSIVFHQTNNFWERLRTGIKYIFGTHAKEVSISLNKSNAGLLQSMISYVKIKNQELEKENE